MTSGIYCYKNKINGKMYVGQSIDLERRRKKMDYSNSTMFYSALIKYGMSNFEYTILEECEVSELDSREIYWIGELRTYPPSLGYGYNLTSGGGHYEMSDETRKKLSMCKMGDKNWNRQHKGEEHPLHGRSISDEHKKNISESRTGEKHWLYGKTLPSEWSEKIRNSMIGKKNTLGQKNQPNASSMYYGVQYRKTRGSWNAVLKYNNRTIYIGSSRDEETAARMYDKYVKENNLPHPLNFLDKGE